MKGGVRHSVIPSARPSDRPSARPISVVVRKTSGRGSSIRPSARPNARPIGVVVRKTSGRGSSIRPSSSAVISKHGDNFNFHDFYNKLMNTDVEHLPSTIESMKFEYVTRTTLQPGRAYLNMTGLKFVNYLYGKYQHSNTDKEKIRSIISLFDQYGMSHGIRNSDLPIVEGQVDRRYYACYKDLYEDIYKKLFPRGNNDYYPVSLSAIPLYCKPRLQTVHEDDE